MAEQNSYPMTQAKLDELKAELRHKVEVERPALAARLKAAIELGDLSENADYHTAKEEQGFLEGRIQQLEYMIRNAVIIEEQDTLDGTVQIGSRVTVIEEGNTNPEEFVIVGKVEANPREGKISNESPLGQALLDHKVGDRIIVRAPGGELVFKIVAIN
jgi:transcription elongation factor GreA